MAYSDSTITLERMLPLLEPLLQGESAVWRVEPNRVRWFAYRIREALRLAQNNPELVPELARRRWRIEVTSAQEVRAVPITYPEVQLVTASPEARMDTQVSSLQEILGAVGSAVPGNKLYFPRADLSPAELSELYNQLAGQHLLFEAAGALTIIPFDPELEELAWSPP